MDVGSGRRDGIWVRMDCRGRSTRTGERKARILLENVYSWGVMAAADYDPEGAPTKPECRQAKENCTEGG